jgi:hypothetical protein
MDDWDGSEARRRADAAARESEAIRASVARDSAARAERAASPTPSSSAQTDAVAVLRGLMEAIDAFDGKEASFTEKLDRHAKALRRARRLLAGSPATAPGRVPLRMLTEPELVRLVTESWHLNDRAFEMAYANGVIRKFCEVNGLPLSAADGEVEGAQNG